MSRCGRNREAFRLAREAVAGPLVLRELSPEEFGVLQRLVGRDWRVRMLPAPNWTMPGMPANRIREMTCASTSPSRATCR